MPVKGRISGHFGGQRIMNGRKMNPHQGTDIAAPEGTPVKAASNGIVRLSGGNYFYSGNTVVIDHGHRLFTIYAHLKKLPSNRAIMSNRDRSSAKSAKPDVLPARTCTGERRSTACASRPNHYYI